jgi:hypothetical protein
MSVTGASKLISPISSMIAHYGLHAATCAAIATSAFLCSRGSYTSAASVVAVSLAAGLLVSGRVSLDALVLLWFAATPVASFYLRYPFEKTVITFDRAAFAVVLLFLIKRWRETGKFPSTKFEIAWALLSALALSSAIIESNNVGYAMRIAVDSFWLPLLAFHIARHHVDIRRKASAFILAAAALSVMLFVTGAYELRRGVDLFKYPGSQLLREGEIRVNGPFISDSSYAIICLILGLLLWSAPTAFRVRLDRSGILMHRLAVGLAMAAALLPLFRAVAAAMFVCWVIIARLAVRRSVLFRARLPALVLALFAILVSLAALATTTRGQRLMDPYNLIGRLATWETAAIIAFENPLSGVGLTNYTDYFRDKYFTGVEARESVLDVRALNSPHSNPLWIASELGSVAFVLYLVANVYILRMGLSGLRRRAGDDRRAAAASYLALAAAYWIPGLTLSSGVYSDLNLYFFFLLGLLAKIICGGDSSGIEQAQSR